MANFNIKKVLGLPQVLEENTLYFVPEGDDYMKMYLSSSDGSSYREIEVPEPTDTDLSGTIDFSEEAPDPETTDAPLWWDPVNGRMYVKYDDGNSVQWVEASPQLASLTLSGSGVADTAARSDHTHNSIVVEDAEW